MKKKKENKNQLVSNYWQLGDGFQFEWNWIPLDFDLFKPFTPILTI